MVSNSALKNHFKYTKFTKQHKYIFNLYNFTTDFFLFGCKLIVFLISYLYLISIFSTGIKWFKSLQIGGTWSFNCLFQGNDITSHRGVKSRQCMLKCQRTIGKCKTCKESFSFFEFG